MIKVMPPLEIVSYHSLMIFKEILAPSTTTQRAKVRCAGFRDVPGQVRELRIDGPEDGRNVTR